MINLSKEVREVGRRPRVVVDTGPSPPVVSTVVSWYVDVVVWSVRDPGQPSVRRVVTRFMDGFHAARQETRNRRQTQRTETECDRTEFSEFRSFVTGNNFVITELISTIRELVLCVDVIYIFVVLYE